MSPASEVNYETEAYGRLLSRFISPVKQSNFSIQEFLMSIEDRVNRGVTVCPTRLGSYLCPIGCFFFTSTAFVPKTGPKTELSASYFLPSLSKYELKLLFYFHSVNPLC